MNYEKRVLIFVFYVKKLEKLRAEIQDIVGLLTR